MFNAIMSESEYECLWDAACTNGDCATLALLSDYVFNRLTGNYVLPL